MRVSDLIGELQDMQSGTNTSTAADLLKQGAGKNMLCFVCNVEMLHCLHFVKVVGEKKVCIYSVPECITSCPVAQWLEHGNSNAKVTGSIPQDCT